MAGLLSEDRPRRGRGLIGHDDREMAIFDQLGGLPAGVNREWLTRQALAGAERPDEHLWSVRERLRALPQPLRAMAMPAALLERAGMSGVDSVLQGIAEPGRVVRGEREPSVAGAMSVAGVMGPGALLAKPVGGAVGAGVRGRAPRSKPPSEPPPPDLPMDVASRLQRAQDAGFRIRMPLFHGSDRSFEAFDPKRRGRATGAQPAALGVWVAVGPEIANDFARLAAERGSGRKVGQNPQDYPPGSQVYPLLHRTSNPVAIALKGDEPDLVVKGMILDAWDAGHDAVMLRNYTSPGGKVGNIIVVRNENQLRSPHAAFDPARRDETDLLAARGVPLPAGDDKPRYRTGGSF